MLDVAWSADGTRLAVGGSVGIWVYDTRTGAEISLLTGHIYKVNAIAFSPDGLTLASGSRDDMVRLWDAATGQEKSTLTGHTYDVEAGGILAGWDDAGKRQSRRYSAVVGRGNRTGKKHHHRRWVSGCAVGYFGGVFA